MDIFQQREDKKNFNLKEQKDGSKLKKLLKEPEY